MTPPSPDLWKRGVLTLIPGEGGHQGSLTYDGMTLHIRRWRKEASGVVVFEVQHHNDGWVDREISGEKAP